MHQDVLVATLLEKQSWLLHRSRQLALWPVELAVLSCSWALAFRCTNAPWLVNSPRLGVRRAAHAAKAPRGRREQQTRAGYPCKNVREGSTLTFDGHTSAGNKEGRGRGCLVSLCTLFVVIVLCPIALHPPGQIVPPGILFLFQHDDFRFSSCFVVSKGRKPGVSPPFQRDISRLDTPLPRCAPAASSRISVASLRRKRKAGGGFGADRGGENSAANQDQAAGVL